MGKKGWIPFKRDRIDVGHIVTVVKREENELDLLKNRLTARACYYNLSDIIQILLDNDLIYDDGTLKRLIKKFGGIKD